MNAIYQADQIRAIRYWAASPHTANEVFPEWDWQWLAGQDIPTVSAFA